MNKKTLLILLILVAVLVVVWGIKEQMGQRRTDTGALSVSVLNAIDPARVNQIEIAGGEETIVLKREGEGWNAGEAVADGVKVKGALETLAGASFTGPVARARENHEALGVGDSAVRVTVQQDGIVYAFSVGTGGPVYRSSYVRLESEDEVYLADVNLKFTFPSSAASWEKKEDENKQSEE